jgi:hypothetical protein
MARKPDATGPANPPVKTGKRASFAPIWIGLTIIGVVIISLATVLLMFFGMLPTMVALIIDRTRQKYAVFCVGGMNFGGVFPYLLDLWAGENTAGSAMEILTNVFSLALMYGAAGFGWMIFIAVPPVVGAFLNVLAQHRVSQLRRDQKELIEEWGEDVAASMNEPAG